MIDGRVGGHDGTNWRVLFLRKTLKKAIFFAFDPLKYLNKGGGGINGINPIIFAKWREKREYVD
jgi:hypothetical protein